ncbi:MAG: N-acetylmuramoyl-L-alanine amidase [bacterium]
MGCGVRYGQRMHPRNRPATRTRTAARYPALALISLAAWAAGAGAWGPSPAAAARSPQTLVLGVRHFATTGYARVVLILNRETLDFRVGRLKKPPRLFLDIPAGRLGRRVKIPRLRGSGPDGRSLVRKLRFGRPRGGRLRLVMDLEPSSIRHRVFTLPEPDRIVIDLRRRGGEGKRATRAGPDPSRAKKARGKGSRREKGRRDRGKKGRSAQAGRPFRIEERRAPPSAAERRRALDVAARFRAGVGRIVLDPGHGGRDPGAKGLYGLVEKTFVLDITRRAERILAKRLRGNRLRLTRRRDRYIPLERRTEIANEFDADVFVSIHANSAPIRRTQGVETYLLSEASSARALKLAARESNTSVDRMTDLQKILNDLMLRSKVTESHQLAKSVQTALVSRLNRRFGRVKNLGVKRGPFFVLLGARMPSILIETAFISNPTEAKRSRKAKYRQAIAKGIADGISRFVGLRPRRARRERPIRGASLRLSQGR